MRLRNLIIIAILISVGAALVYAQNGEKRMAKPPYTVKDPQIQKMFQDLYGRLSQVESKPSATKEVRELRTYVNSLASVLKVPTSNEVTQVMVAPLQPSLADGVRVGQVTPASLVAVNKYYKNLRLTPGSPANQKVVITADVLTLVNTFGDTLVLTDVNVTCDVTVSGPVVNGRDQSAQFAQYDWPNFYVIYNSSAQVQASLASLSATAPTLPTGYDYSMRVGARWCDLANQIYQLSSLNRKTWWGANAKLALNDQDIAAAGTWYSVDLSNSVPPTAMGVFGNFGQTTGTAGNRGLAVASSNTGQCKVSGTINGFDASTNFEPSAAVWFEIPLLTPQTIWHTGDDTNLNMTVVIAGWEDEI